MNSYENKIKLAEEKSKKEIEKAKMEARQMIDNTNKSAVDYINDITDKAQKFTAKKIEEAENKTIEILEDTKATAESTARMVNNITKEKSKELKNTLDKILFD